MVSTVVVHVIGFTALIAVLAIIIGYIGYTTHSLIMDNERKNFEKITESLALQLRYLLRVSTNLSIVLRYPLEVIYNREYNIIIGSGRAIMENYDFISGLDNDTIYVVAADFSNYVYAYTPIVENISSKPIVLSENPKIFGSATITVVEKIDMGDSIQIIISIKGVRKS